MILDFVKEQLHLSSPLALLLVLAIGIVWLWRRPVSRGPRAYLTAAVFGFWFAATPIGAFALNYPLSRGATRVMNIGDARGAEHRPAEVALLLSDHLARVHAYADAEVSVTR